MERDETTCLLVRVKASQDSYCLSVCYFYSRVVSSFKRYFGRENGDPSFRNNGVCVCGGGGGGGVNFVLWIQDNIENLHDQVYRSGQVTVTS